MSSNRLRRVRAHIVGGATVLFAAALAPAAADTLTLQGATTFNARLMVPYQGAIEKESGHKLIVVPNKSNLGILALFEQRADLAMISAPLEAEVTALRRTKPNLPFDRLKAFEVARTRVAFAIHPSNPVRSIDRETMRRILSGEITNWREIGGADLPIRIVTPREGGGVPVSIENALLGGRRMSAPDIINVQIGSQVPKIVAQEPSALGLAQLSLLRHHNLPEITIDPPIAQVLVLVTMGEPTQAMKDVIKAARDVASAKLD
jgi:phosphate transport system substrate-binding protein